MNRARIHQFSAWACSVFMLGLLPLLFRDAFFDINRVKVQAVCFVCPVLFAFTISCTCKRKNCSGIAHCEGVSAFMLLWLVSALISYIASGFDPAVLSGSEGRYCGLFFLFSCGAAFYTISSMRYGDFAAWLAICTAAFVAALGLLHTYGVDPLGFYVRIQKGQTQYFLSTIGNIDFFGAYLAMVLPFAMGLAIFSEALSLRLLGFAASLIQMAGVACAHTDVAFAAMQVSCLLLFTLSSETWGSIRRALFLWSFSWLMLPAIQAYMHHGHLTIDYSGVLLALCESRAAHVIGIILLFSAILTYFAENLHIALPERRSALQILFALSFLFIAVLIASMVFITYFQLGDDDISSLLRFSDTWGSRRGFVYRCSLNALQEYMPLQWLFGKGLDKTRAILTP